MSAGTLGITLHFFLSPGDSDSQIRASVSQGERNCSAPHSLFTWEAMLEVCALHCKSLEDTWAGSLSQGSKEQERG